MDVQVSYLAQSLPCKPIDSESNLSVWWAHVTCFKCFIDLICFNVHSDVHREAELAEDFVKSSMVFLHTVPVVQTCTWIEVLHRHYQSPVLHSLVSSERKITNRHDLLFCQTLNFNAIKLCQNKMDEFSLHIYSSPALINLHELTSSL